MKPKFIKGLTDLYNDMWFNKVDDQIIKVDQPLILITQIQRSGGTLMSQLFDDHPECFAYPGEIEWGQPTKYHWPNIEINGNHPQGIFNGFDSDTLNTFIRSGYCKQSWTTIVKEVLPFSFNKKKQKRIFVQLFKKNAPSKQRDILNYYLSAFFNSWSDYQNLYRKPKKYVTGFTPRVNMTLGSSDLFFRDYPDGYLISIIRHPADWIVSARRHNPRDYSDFDGSLRLWCDSVRSSMALKEKYQDQVLLVGFESLIKDSREVMQKICSVVNLTWDDSLCVPTFNSMPIKADSSFEVHSHGIIKETLSRRVDLDANEASKIDRLTGQLYRDACSMCL